MRSADLLSFLVALAFAASAKAATLSHDPVPEARARAAAFNAHLVADVVEAGAADAAAAVRPFADDERVGYVILSSDGNHDEQVKPKLLAALPPEVTSIVLVDDPEDARDVRARWGALRPPGKLKFMLIPDSHSNGAFWSRDTLPLPTFAARGLELVQARSWHGYEPGDSVGRYFSSRVARNPYFFEGGNLRADTRGNCFVVNHPGAASIPDRLFRELYGCRALFRLPQQGGIGHVDERLILFERGVALTDTESYRVSLEAAGYRVTLLPRAGGTRTYLNALPVNDTLFVPVFETADDDIALDVYRSLAAHVVPLDSRRLSDEGKGSIHCITMAYPEGTFTPDAGDGFLRFR